MLERPAYLSIFVTPTVVLAVLAWTGRSARGHAFIAAFMVALAVTLMLFAFLPAQSALAYHIGMRPAYLPTTGMDHIAVIAQLRDGTLTAIDPGTLLGIITFPSVHTISALLFMWAGWPVRRLRAPLIAVNVAMLASIPIGGTHYLADMIGGCVVAAFSVGVLGLPARLRRWRQGAAAPAVPALAGAVAGG